MSKPINVIVAATENGGIGARGTIPWRLKRDMLYFRHVTTLFSETTGTVRSLSSGENVGTTGTDERPINAVIMGRKTWDSIPVKFRPLPDRVNVVITSRWKEMQEDLPSALSHLSTIPELDAIFVIGGARLYADALGHPLCRRVFLTRVWRTGCRRDPPSDAPTSTASQLQTQETSSGWDFDTYFPALGAEWTETEEAVERVTQRKYNSSAGEENGVGYRFTVLEREQR
ncbi:hypothetical protein HDU93_001295 [Gonapodya sp. JEL0774]|nr:hypothetical protein HDU93_001295 [Gonapodya sp. JEL0774]